MKSFIKEYFNYSKGEKRGIIVLLVLIIVVFMIPLIHNKIRERKILDYSEFEKQLSQFEPLPNPETSNLQTEQVTCFNFDPNTIIQSDLVKLGLTTQQAQTLINYRKAGGVFKKPDDLLKIYSLSKDQYEKLKSYIQIQNTEPQSTKPTTEFAKVKDAENTVKNTEIIELNTADTIDLIRLPGIGSVFARRIVEYRNFLGGFYKKEQLLEVYGLSAEAFSSIQNQITIDTSYIQKMNLNSIDFKALNKHPYITYAHTKSILKYRQLMGNISSTQTILDNHLVDTLTYNKIKYYITVN